VIQGGVIKAGTMAPRWVTPISGAG
jgi:hypothetical protein